VVPIVHSACSPAQSTLRAADLVESEHLAWSRVVRSERFAAGSLNVTINPDSAQQSTLIRMLVGVALLALWFSIALRNMLDAEVAGATDAVTFSLLISDNVDDIIDALDRLEISQRAFLSTDDVGYSDEIYTSAVQLTEHMAALCQLSRNDQILTEEIGRLAKAVHHVLNSIGYSNDIQRTLGSAAAMAFLDNDQSVVGAKSAALELKRRAAATAFDRIRGGPWSSKERSIRGHLWLAPEMR